MATISNLKKIAKTFVSLDTSASKVFVEQSHYITKQCRQAFGGDIWNVPKDEIVKIADLVAEESPWKNTFSEKVRRSEIASIVKAYPYLSSACAIFERQYKALTRVHMLKIARLCPQCETPNDAALLAIKFFNAKKPTPKNSSAKSSAEKTRAGIMQAIKHCGNTRMEKSLLRLCKTYNISLAR